MRSGKRIFVLILFALSLCIFSGQVLAQSIVYGDSASLGAGTVRSWTNVGPNGVPEAMGVTLSAAALSSLPDTGQSIVLDLPNLIADSLFTHVFLNWNPIGHEPGPIYGLPHFDFHFFVIPNSEREQITPGPDPIPVAPQYLPTNYINGDGHFAVPGMGVHYVDSTSAEFHGQTFTTTMVYGFYHGEFVFVEPMITRAYLLTNPDTTMAIPQPAAYQRAGYYPTTYSIMYNSLDYSYTVELGNFVYQQATAADPEPRVSAPSTYALLQNYPNPFNPATTIEFDLPQAGHVTLKVFNELGENVATLVDGPRSQGTHQVSFDGGRLSSGVYLYQLQSGSVTLTRKMLLVK